MTQDTRKDRRVKIVSLNVRYKSATVDEFIENHAHDVSRGGIFIKTANPFPPGTLLKFEIRLASDQAVIAGVGRIVWKRDAGTTSGERPAGMGVKFIKIDEPSKAIIDRLVNTKDDAGKSFEGGDEAAQPPARTRSTPPARNPSSGGSPVAGPASQRAPAARSVTPAAGTPAVAGPPLNRKATMIGIGATPLPGSSSPPGASSSPSGRPPFPSHPAVPPRPNASAAMFPDPGPAGDMPAKEDQTVMRQAAELLEDALREAGGSMAEINPIFSAPAPAPTPSPVPSASAPEPATTSLPTPSSEWTTADTPKALAATVAALRAGEAGAHPSAEKRSSERHRSTRDTPTSIRPAPTAARSQNANRNTGTVIALVIAAAFALAGAILFRDQLFGGGAPPEPVAAPANPPPTPPTPTAMASVTTMTVPPAQTASPGAAPSGPASVASDRPTAATPQPPTNTIAPAAPLAESVAPPTPRPPKPAPKRSSAPSPAVDGTPSESSAAAVAAVPKPAAPPKPKPEKPADDNPY